MTQYGVDYPWSKPAPAALKAAGVTFAMRYLSRDAGKNLTIAEANALGAAGIWCSVVWETTATRALDGRAAGAADAREALRQATACGMPAGRPVYFAVDTDTTWSQVVEYFRGVRDVLPAAQVGVYGGIRIIVGAADSGLVTWFWQAEAWSGGRWEPRAHIRQAGTARIGGVDCDKNTATTSDFGQWMPGRTPTLAEEDELATTLSQERSDQWNSMIWGLKYTAETTLALVQAQGATIEKLAAALAAVHGIDEAALVEEIKAAIAAAVVKVDVTVGQNPNT
ncbi:uncharacterized protein DUF1906 [Streptomyces sp. TLI_235]|nr:glycoside hydrolase domain-containing protein [Streptomyces sp. TLI_235]PBC71590.1 uncharacterized protein DUF1906 [Streptomyces sp. TLI_235]